VGFGLSPILKNIEPKGLVNKLSSIFGWLWLRLAVSAKLGLPTSRPAFCFLASLVLAQPKTKPNFFTSPKSFLLAYSWHFQSCKVFFQAL